MNYLTITVKYDNCMTANRQTMIVPKPRLQRRIQEIEKFDVKKKRQIMQLLDTFIANEKLRQKVEAKQVA